MSDALILIWPACGLYGWYRTVKKFGINPFDFIMLIPAIIGGPAFLAGVLVDEFS